MEKLSRNNGSISIIVIVTVLVLTVILVSVLFVTLSQEKGQVQSNLKIKEIYEKDVNRVDEIYNEIVSYMEEQNALKENTQSEDETSE